MMKPMHQYIVRNTHGRTRPVYLCKFSSGNWLIVELVNSNYTALGQL